MDRFRARLLRRQAPQQSQNTVETASRDDGTNITTTRRRSAHPATTSAKADNTSAKAKTADTTPIKEDPVSPLVSARSLRSAKRDSMASPVQPLEGPPTGQAHSISGISLQSQENEDLPPAKSTRLSVKQQQDPQPESDVIVARRQSLREPPAKRNIGTEGPTDEVRVLRQSTRRKSNVEQAVEQRDEQKVEESSFSVPNKRRSARHVSTKEAEATDVVDHDDTPLSPTATRSLRSVPKNKPLSPPKVTTRRYGSTLIITGIRTWPEELHPSLKIKLKTSAQANFESPSNFSRKRRRMNAGIAAEDDENDDSPRKRLKETDGTARGGRIQRKVGSKVEPFTENGSSQSMHNITDNDDSQLEDSFELVKDDETNTRADRAARRNAKSEQVVQGGPDEEQESPTNNTKQPARQEEPATSVNLNTKDNETLAPPVSPNLLPVESLPPMFLDFPEKPLPETAFADKAAYLHAQRYRPLPPLARFTAALLSHAPTSRSTETLLALAVNTQRALQAYQDEYIELDLKTSRVSGPVPKKAATGGRQVMDEIKWQAEKEKELFGEGSILAGLRKAAAADTITKRHKERKARRGEVDMLAAGLAPGKSSGTVPKINVFDADEIAERGRAQRSRKPVKRFEDAIADAERAPSKRRKKNLESLVDEARNSAPPTVAAGKKSLGDKSRVGSDNEEEEDEGLIKPKWNNPSRPQSSLARAAQFRQAATKPATSTTQTQPPTRPAEPQQHPHYMPPYHHPSVMGYPVYGPYPPPPGPYYPPYAGHYPGHPMPALPPQAHHEHYYAHPPPHYYHPHPGAAPPGHHPQPQHMHPHHAHHYSQHPLAQSTLPPQPPPHPQALGHPHPQQPHSTHPDHTTAPNSTSAQPRGQLPGSKDRRKVPNTTGAPTNGTSSGTSRSRKEPHEKSELRSASMTKWWAERKVKIAAQKEQEKKDAEAAALAEAEAEAEAKEKANGAA